MRKIIASFLVCFFVGVGTLNASFPVKKSNDSAPVNETTTTVTTSSEELKSLELAAQEQANESLEWIDKAEKSNDLGKEDWILLLLWFFLGGFAAHRWYAGKPWGWNLLYIFTFGGCGVWAIIDLINILRQDF